ncbi:hypothetical protein ACR91H_22025, partial [Klebsiella pneumoniae]
MGFFIRPEENQQLFIGLVLNIKTQLSGCCLYSLASINISRQLFPAVMPPYPRGGTVAKLAMRQPFVLFKGL